MLNSWEISQGDKIKKIERWLALSLACLVKTSIDRGVIKVGWNLQGGYVVASRVKIFETFNNNGIKS